MRRVCFQTVIIIIYSDKPDPQHGKQLFQIAPNLNVVSAEPGQILYDNAVNHSLLYIFHHGLKRRTIEIRTRKTVVLTDRYDPEFRS